MNAFADVHVHNYLSNCCADNSATAENYVKRYAELGISLLGFANHIWDDRVPGASSWYHKQTLDFSMQIKRMIPADTQGVKVLIGAETEYCGMSDTLGMSPEGAEELDYLLIPHTHVHMRDFVMPTPPEFQKARQRLKAQLIDTLNIPPVRAEAMAKLMKEPDLGPWIEGEQVDYNQYVADFMVRSFEGLMNHPHLQTICKKIPVSVAHPFQPVGDSERMPAMLRLISDADFSRIFHAAAKLGVGLEINGSCHFPEMLHMLKLAKDEGCRFTLGSDTHTVKGASGIFNTEPTIAALGLTKSDFMDFLCL